MFLPDHFLYRGVVRTVVHFLVMWGRKHKREIMDCRPTVDTLNENSESSKFVWEVITKIELLHILEQLIDLVGLSLKVN